jgi:HK97 gp10 family phage protein
MPSDIKRSDGKPGSLSSIFDDLEHGLGNGVRAGVEMCARMTQKEVVARCPVKTGNLKRLFSAPEAVGKDEGGKWVFGLITPELAARGQYWKWVEFGTKGRPVRGARRGRKRGRVLRAGIPHPPHPFFRPGVAAARKKWMAIMMYQMSIALRILGVRADRSTSALAESSETAEFALGLQIAAEMDRRARAD